MGKGRKGVLGRGNSICEAQGKKELSESRGSKKTCVAGAVTVGAGGSE